MALVSDIINEAFLDLKVIQPGQTITTAMQSDAFLRANQMLDSWSDEGLVVPNQVAQTFALAAGSIAYTLGASGTFATSGSLRAQRVTAWRAFYAGVLHTGGQPMSMDEFGKLAKQTIGETSSVPMIVGTDTAYPNLNVRVFPPPSGNPGSIELFYWTPIAQFATVGDTVTLPSGFQDALHYNLAVRLYPQYARQGGIPPELAAMAQATKAAIVEQNNMYSTPGQSAAAPQPARTQ